MEKWQITRARLITAVFSHRSILNGQIIYQCLGELEEIATKEQEGELQRYRDLVQTWTETWYPELKNKQK